MNLSRTRTNHRSSVLAALRRSSKKVRLPVKNEADEYGAFIWALANKFTNSPEEAEAAVREMETDIARCAEKGPAALSTEDVLVEHIAWRRLLSFLQ